MQTSTDGTCGMPTTPGTSVNDASDSMEAPPPNRPYTRSEEDEPAEPTLTST